MNLKEYKKFAILWLINAILLYFFNMILPAYYTLGNSIFKPYQAVVITSFVWSYLLWSVEPALKRFEIELKGNTNMAIGYLIINFAIVWLIARYSLLTGIGIASYVYVFFLALIANFLQYLVWLKIRDKK